MNFNKLLNEKGLKATPQRLLILNTIKDGGHIDIEKIYEKINKIIPSISIATVYKNLKLLVDKGIIKEVHINSFKTLYEVNTSFHIHLVCKKCKKITDIEVNEKSIFSFFNKLVKEDVENFDVTGYYICENCKN